MDDNDFRDYQNKILSELEPDSKERTAKKNYFRIVNATTDCLSCVEMTMDDLTQHIDDLLSQLNDMPSIINMAIIIRQSYFQGALDQLDRVQDTLHTIDLEPDLEHNAIDVIINKVRQEGR